MSRGFDIDLRRLQRALNEAPESILRGAIRGMHDVLDEWKAESVDIAPIDTSTLRRSILPSRIRRLRGLNLVADITANAIEVTRRGRFNYAYYIHEQNAGGKRLRTPGTVKKFLEVPLEQNDEKWVRHIENEIHAELRRDGW